MRWLKANGVLLFCIAFLSAVGGFFAYSYYTFWGIKNNTEFTFGFITENYQQGKHDRWHSRYQFSANDSFYTGIQGGKFNVNEMVVIVFDDESPQYSMIADYPAHLIGNSDTILLDGDTLFVLKIDTLQVKYSWWDYILNDK